MNFNTVIPSVNGVFMFTRVSSRFLFREELIRSVPLEVRAWIPSACYLQLPDQKDKPDTALCLHESRCFTGVWTMTVEQSDICTKWTSLNHTLAPMLRSYRLFLLIHFNDAEVSVWLVSEGGKWGSYWTCSKTSTYRLVPRGLDYSRRTRNSLKHTS